jgi:hypothetical protein
MPSTLSVRSFTPPPVAALGDEARIHLKAARMWVMLARHHRNPKPVLASLLGTTTAAFCMLMEQLVTAWPDAFTAYPPCASAVSPDEAALLGLLEAARDETAEEADRLLADLLPPGDRHRLWAGAVRCAARPAHF